MIITEKFRNLLPFRNSDSDEYKNEKKDREEDLREFIYLDNISVTSLLASLSRGVPESLKESDTKKKSRGLGASASPWDVGIKGQVENVTKNSTEVVKKFEDQSKFNELYHLHDHRELTSPDEEKVFSLEDLNRGVTLELKINLNAYFLYHFYKFSSYFLDLFEEVPISQKSEAGEMKKIMKVIEALFSDEIPVVGKVENYKFLEEERKIEHNGNLDGEEGTEFSIVGTLNPDMLWQNPSIFLYKESQFTAYCRISQAEIKEEWNPLKPTQALNSLFPKLGDEFSQIVEQAKREFPSTTFELEDQTSLQTDMAGYLNTFLNQLEKKENLNLGDQEKKEIIEEVKLSDFPSTKLGLIKALKLTTEVVKEKIDTEIDLGNTTKLRQNIWENLESTENSTLGENKFNVKNRPGLVPSKDLDPEGGFLKVSFIAIYW